MTVQRRLRACHEIDPNCFYSARDLAQRWRVHPITVWKWSGAGKIPKPKRLGPNTVRWLGRAIIEHEQRL